MSPLGKLLWKILPVNVWLNRDKLKEQFTHKYKRSGFQNAISDLFNAGLIALEDRKFDENGLRYPESRQFVRRKTNDEIIEYYHQVVSPKSPLYNQRIFWEQLVRCPKIKQIKYDNPLFKRRRW